MLNMEAQEDVVPGGKIMMAYKKAMELDEENDEYIADFADFALECNRIPVAVKEFKRYATRLEMADIPTTTGSTTPPGTSWTASKSSILSAPPTSANPGSSKPCSGPWWLGFTRRGRQVPARGRLRLLNDGRTRPSCPARWATSVTPFTAARFNLTW